LNSLKELIQYLSQKVVKFSKTLISLKIFP